eukprot:scaffold110415_cov62-Phaeocystis_antarctica.AAC.4
MSASASERDVWNWAHPRSSTNSRWSLRSVSNEVSENENCELSQQRGGGWRMAAARLATASRLPRATMSVARDGGLSARGEVKSEPRTVCHFKGEKS